MTHKGLRKTEQIMPWKSLLIAMPFVAVWTYYDTKQDIAHIEGAQMALERMFVDTQERAMSGVPRGPMPITEELSVDKKVEEIKESKKISQPPADYRRGLAVVKTQQTVDYVKLDVFCLAKNIFHEAGDRKSVV